MNVDQADTIQSCKPLNKFQSVGNGLWIWNVEYVVGCKGYAHCRPQAKMVPQDTAFRSCFQTGDFLQNNNERMWGQRAKYSWAIHFISQCTLIHMVTNQAMLFPDHRRRIMGGGPQHLVVIIQKCDILCPSCLIGSKFFAPPARISFIYMP